MAMEVRNSQLSSSDCSESSLSWKIKCIELVKHAGKENSEYSHGKEIKKIYEDFIKQKKELEKKLKLTEDEIENVTKQLKEIIINKGDATRNSSLIKLYELITKLTFAIDSPPNEPQGFIADKTFETFQFDTSKDSQQFIIDHLWNLINLQQDENSEEELDIAMAPDCQRKEPNQNCEEFQLPQKRPSSPQETISKIQRLIIKENS
ncbi:hypothetical protein CDAR_214311 [Caerostris darwini]|uniref:Uncharacterized protein n=1 Tax=Caerostris darwini TaxID=1538125 RepID=A0AAV4S4I2_9ARAC|nr:hypothetical protein CDAR_214311 [Caerostris darwini]